MFVCVCVYVCVCVCDFVCMHVLLGFFAHAILKKKSRVKLIWLLNNKKTTISKVKKNSVFLPTNQITFAKEPKSVP